MLSEGKTSTRIPDDADLSAPGRAAAPGDAAVAQLRSYISSKNLHPGDRLLPERLLGPELGLRRGDLRRALETLVDEGVLWRHVGKGTFLARNVDSIAPDDLGALARRVSPADAMRARTAIEPAIAREAALHATAGAIAALRLTAARQREAASWREYEALDADLHRQIAEASGSVVLLALFDQLNALRRVVTWGRIMRQGARPPADHPSFEEHLQIILALENCDPEAAQAAMRAHLRSVEMRIDP